MTVLVPGLAQHSMEWMTAREMFREATGEEPLAWQEDYLAETRDALVLKGRQIGASTSAGVIATRKAKYWPRSLSVIVSPSQQQSNEVRERAKRGILRLGLRLLKDNATMLQLENGSRILSLPGSAKSARGWTADLLVLDEAAFIEDETFLAARATVATGGRTIVQSTPMGPFGNFFELWDGGDPRWARFRVRTDEVPTVDPAFLAREKAQLTPEKYAQEYEAEFTTPGLGLIDPDRLKELTGEERTGPWRILE